MKCSYHAVIFQFGITLECLCLYKIDPCVVIVAYDKQFHHAIYRINVIDLKIFYQIVLFITMKSNEIN